MAQEVFGLEFLIASADRRENRPLHIRLVMLCSYRIKSSGTPKMKPILITKQTSKEGIFAAGDVTDDPFKQNNIAAGDGVRTALSAYNYILRIKKHSPCAEEEE